MVLVGSIDVPLVEVILVLAIIMVLLFVEAIVIIGLLLKQLSKTKDLGVLIERLSEALLAIKKAEIEELDQLRKRK